MPSEEFTAHKHVERKQIARPSVYGTGESQPTLEMHLANYLELKQDTAIGIGTGDPIGLGIFYISTGNYNPFRPSGFGPVMAGAATEFFAVFGYDPMRTAAKESTDGKNACPQAIIFSFVIAMPLYVAATLVLTGLQTFQDIDTTAGFASAFNGIVLPVIATISSMFAALSILTVMLTFLLGVPRPPQICYLARVRIVTTATAAGCLCPTPQFI